MPPVDASFYPSGNPPSSPFVSEVEPHSRLPSAYHAPMHDALMEDILPLAATTSPFKPFHTSPSGALEDKENVPQTDGTRSPITTTPSSLKLREHGSTGGDIMPPPASTRKTPLKPRSIASTPRTYPISAEQTSAFQAGLDVRAGRLPPRDDTTASVDDTCFTAFSEIPDMTQFARIGQSPTKSMRTPRPNFEPTPRTSRKRASSSRSPSPTPRRVKTPGANSDGTTFLIDFTEQLHDVGSTRRVSPVKSATESNLLQYITNQRSPTKGTTRNSYATPSKPNSILNLLDFELPPAPTPRSVPTITVRELESLKSSYLSQISSLKATLSGREAEVESLKRAVGDAEHRVGDAQEALREEQCRREHVEEEKAGWERRGHEVEQVLRNVKEEVLKGEAEKDDMARNLEDCERRLEDSEARVQKAEERFADALVARTSNDDGDGNEDDQVQRLVAVQIDAKIEAVSRELHSVYKEKHERKVSTLKKSYEARSEKKCAEIQARLTELERQHDELLSARDATFTGPAVANASASTEALATLKTQLEEHKASLARMEKEMTTSHQQQDQLIRELQQERIEKGDLVAAVDEMLALQQQAPSTSSSSYATAPPPALALVEDFRKSITTTRPAIASGLKPPASAMGGNGESKIGRGHVPARSISGGKSRMLANIERMGRTATGNASGPE